MRPSTKRLLEGMGYNRTQIDEIRKLRDEFEGAHHKISYSQTAVLYNIYGLNISGALEDWRSIIREKYRGGIPTIQTQEIIDSLVKKAQEEGLDRLVQKDDEESDDDPFDFYKESLESTE